MKVTSRSVLVWVPKDTALRWRLVSRRLGGINMGGGEGGIVGQREVPWGLCSWDDPQRPPELR